MNKRFCKLGNLAARAFFLTAICGVTYSCKDDYTLDDTTPSWLGSSIYILLGWSCLLAFVPIYKNMSTFSFTMLVIGGVIYTIGGVVYALKKPEFDKRHPNFGMHEIFHLFVMGGSIFHYITMYSIL
jgi:hemolysin III